LATGHNQSFTPKEIQPFNGRCGPRCGHSRLTVDGKNNFTIDVSLAKNRMFAIEPLKESW
jgi:hypothetical protein